MTRRGLDRLAARMSLQSVGVAFGAMGLMAVGVLVVARSIFDRLMVDAGSPAQLAEAMFDHGVAQVFVIALVVAALMSVALAIFLARRLSRPLHDMAGAARRVAAGDYATRVPSGGPAEFVSLADSFNRMAQSLAVQEQIRRDFIANAAHELRTPLTNLHGYLEGMRDGVIAPSADQFDSLQEEVDRLVRLSRSLDALAEEGRPDSASDLEFDLAQVMRTASELARPAFEAKSIGFDVRLPHRLALRGDPDRLAQVLSNLLQNASRYTPDRGHVLMTAEELAGGVKVTVTNSGDGIPEADLPRVFERFYRVEKSRHVARGGAGIGLAIVKQIVEGSGGEVGADSAPGLTSFWFRLPA